MNTPEYRSASRLSGVVRRSLLTLIVVLAGLHGSAVLAQGDGPRSQIQIPTGLNFLVPTYLNLTGNYNLAGTILVPGAEIDPGVFVLTYMRAFSIGDRYGQIWVNPIYGRYRGRATVTDPLTGDRIEVSQANSGFGDPLVNFKIGLVGIEPLGPKELAQHAPSFQMSAFAAVSFPIGDYSNDELLNIGTNVWSLRLGLPMVVPLGDPQHATYLEVFPSVTFYGDNDDPTGGANNREQDYLFGVESHLSHNFTPKFWASLDLRYRNGGETTTDGISDGNEQNVWGGGISAGYAITRTISAQATYGQVLNSSDKSELDMFRVKVAFIF